ncbi:MAG: nitroreductase family protein [Deltaproteobacteria bacterium]|jgi:nitroreductase|nr:nitroreductase family protein [Deltaproteobacteria bacterium]
MDFSEVLRRRRSTRSFLDQEITEAELSSVILAGSSAPVGSNLYRDLHLTVLRDRKIMRSLCQANERRMKDPIFFEKVAGEIVKDGKEPVQREPFYGAPVVIIVSHRKQSLQPGIEYANAASVVQTMHLAATSLGLGSVYAWGALEAMREAPELDKTALLNLPEGFEPLLGLMLGRSKTPLSEKALAPGKLPVTYI